MAPASDTSASPRSIAGGRYLLRRRLGEGSRKRVYLADDTRLGRRVAVALVRPDRVDAGAIARLRQEARVLGRLGDHPNVVTVYDVGDDEGQPYVVSQLMESGSVEELLAAAPLRRLPVTEAIRISDQICRALGHAHDHGIVHRDLKPANVWVTSDGTAKLGDFGLALDAARLAEADTLAGTVAYMAPEYALGDPPDARTDLYALGVMLYELVTGRLPFVGDDAVGVLHQHINTPPVTPSVLNSELPPALETLILRLLAKTPDERPPNAAAVREALAGALGTDAPPAEPAVNPLDRLAAGVFVGRETEMRTLRAALDDAHAGRGRVLLLAGDPGIGKTRTAAAVATYARLRGARVCWGRCHEGEGAPAFWPWVQIIRAYVETRERDALRAELGGGGAEIAQIVPDVRTRVPGLPDPRPADSERARSRLFDAVATFLRKAARAGEVGPRGGSGASPASEYGGCVNFAGLSRLRAWAIDWPTLGD